MKKLIAAGATVVAMGALAGPAAAQPKVPPQKNVPPNCERGQLTAAANAARKGKADQAAKHTAKAAACAAGQPPRSGGGGIGS